MCLDSAGWKASPDQTAALIWVYTVQACLSEYSE